jgi:hypothetical protein
VHGSGAGGLVLAGAAIGPDDAGVSGAAGGRLVVGCGVLATVESPDPQPLSVAVMSAAPASPVNRRALQGRIHHTRLHRTVTGPTIASGVAD